MHHCFINGIGGLVREDASGEARDKLCHVKEFASLEDIVCHEYEFKVVSKSVLGDRWNMVILTLHDDIETPKLCLLCHVCKETTHKCCKMKHMCWLDPLKHSLG